MTERPDAIDDHMVDWIGQHRERLRTPIYLYNESALRAAVEQYRRLMPENARLFYSPKANPQPEIIRFLAQQGVGAEVTGSAEWELCKLAGVPSRDTIVGGVSKSAEVLSAATYMGVAAVVIDSIAEWDFLKTASAHGKDVSALIRLNLGASSRAHFGVDIDDALRLADEAVDHVHVLGVHFYLGGQRLRMTPLIESLQAAGEALEAYQRSRRASAVGVGLGIGVPYAAGERGIDRSTLREQLSELWNQPPWRDVQVYGEAGRALVAECGYFVSRVLDVKSVAGRRCVVTDGGLHVHNPGVGLGSMFRSHPRFAFVTRDGARDTETVDIAGNLCTPMDCLARDVVAPRLHVGDLVIITNAGAYCLTSAMWGFNSRPLCAEGWINDADEMRLLEPQYGSLRLTAHTE